MLYIQQKSDETHVKLTESKGLTLKFASLAERVSSKHFDECRNNSSHLFRRKTGKN